VEEIKIHTVLSKVRRRQKVAVFVEWSNLVLAHHLYIGQKATAENYQNAILARKAFMGLNFYRIFSRK
jgi:hypothetical protein